MEFAALGHVNGQTEGGKLAELALIRRMSRGVQPRLLRGGRLRVRPHDEQPRQPH